MSTRALEAREAEVSCLGAIMLDDRAFARVAAVVDAAHWFVPAHRVIWRAMEACDAAGEPIDQVTLSTRLEASGELEAAGGFDYLEALDRTAASSTNIEHHARLVVDAAILRQVDRFSGQLRDMVRDGAPLDVVMGRIQDHVQGVVQARPKETAWRYLAELMPEAMERVEARKSGTSKEAPGLKSQFKDAEQLFGSSGFGLSDMLVLAGRPSMGKTAAALQLAIDYAADSREKGEGDVLVFSLETTVKKLVDRLLAAQAQVDLNRVRAGTLGQDEMYRVQRAADAMARLPMAIDARKGLTVEDIAATVAAHPRKVAAVFIDYLQIVNTRRRFGPAREQQVAYIAQTLKDLADRGGEKEPHKNTRVVALAQLARPRRDRKSKAVPRPTIADLRESGHIEQCADVIILLHRPSHYDPAAPDSDPRAAEWIFGKNRDGATGLVNLRYIGERVRFDNVTLQHGMG